MAKTMTHKVITTNGNLHSEHTNADQAEKARDRANAEAQKLGIETRYDATTI